MKRKLTFLISAICCILLLSTLSIYFFLNCRQNAMGQTSDGVFSFERTGITTAFLLLRQKNMPKHLPLLCQTLMQIKYLFLRPTRSPGNASA